MSENTVVHKSGGIGCLTLMFLIFLTLKLAQVGVVAEWSWWWIFSPLWMPVALLLGMALVMLVVMVLTLLVLKILNIRD